MRFCQTGRKNRQIHAIAMLSLAMLILSAINIVIAQPTTGKYQPATTTNLEIKDTIRKTILDYMYANAGIIIIAFVALMSYRFFSSRRFDFQDMWDEWKGKK
jgi:hypothetical protein